MRPANPIHSADVDRTQVQVAGSCLLAGGLVFFLFNTIAEGLYPNYSVATDSLSELGYIGASTSILWNGQVFVFGVLVLSGMYLLFYRRHLRLHERGSNLVAISYMLPGAGAMLVSLFPGNSALDLLHGIGSLLVFVFGGVSAIYSYRLINGPIRYFSAILGVVTLVFVAIPPSTPVLFSVLGERLIVYPYILWLVCFGTYLASTQRSQTALV
jgi:hypothetical membrane protein